MPERLRYAKMSDAQRQFVDWLIEEKGIPPESLDIDPHGVPEEISFEEAAAFALKSEKWQDYLPGLDMAGLKHPLDTRNYPPEIRERIQKLAAEANEKIKLTPKNEGYCEAFFDEFFALGAKNFTDGGICLAYDWRVSIAKEEHEQTSEEAFTKCMTSPEETGSCTEHTYMPMGAVLLAGVPCSLEMMETEKHVFPACNGKSYDASGIGYGFGWASRINPAAVYYHSYNAIPDPSKDARQNVDYYNIVTMISPENYVNMKAVYSGKSSDNVEKILDAYEPLISQSNLRTDVFLAFGYMIFSYSMSGNREKAEEMAFAILRRWPDNPQSLKTLEFIARNAEEALNLSRELSAEHPDTGWGETFRAKAFEYQDKSDEAFKLFLKAAQMDENNTIARRSLAVHYIVRGNFKEAINAIQSAVELAPSMSDNLYILSDILIYLGKPMEALSVIDRNPMKYEQNSHLHLLASTLLTDIGRPELAIPALNSFLNSPADIDYMIPRIYEGLAKAYLMMGEMQTAREMSAKLASADSLDVDPMTYHKMMTRIYSASNDMASAKHHLDIIFSNGPNGPEFDFLSLNILLESGSIKEAQEFLAELETRHSMHNLLPYYKTLVLLHSEGPDKAREYLSQVIGEDQNNIFMQEMNTLLSIFEGYNPGPERTNSYFSQTKNIFSIQVLKPLYLLKQGDPEAAKAEADRLLEKNSRNISIHRTRAASLLEMETYDEALEAGVIMQEMFPHKKDGLIVQAMAHLKMGELDEAEEAARQAVEHENRALVLWPLVRPEFILNEIRKRRAEME